ncbi:MAG: translation initiation factor IF-2, partial [Clostridiales bacterium]|nr:translation initiation factor IF-2 [Clostridiales bacterium]
MSMMFKYRVHEVAKDFNVPTKAISEILAKYGTAPKNHMQVLTAQELDIIFQYMTANNQVSSIEEIYTTPAAAEPEAKPGKKTGAKPGARAETKAAEKKAPAKSERATPPAAATTPPAPKREKESRFVARKVPEKRVIDTSGATVNLEKYDERLDKLIPEKAEKMKRGREKFTKRGQQRQQTVAGAAKRRAEERDKLQKLHLEIAKKAAVKVSIPDEISVGDLASRMKKSGAEVVKNLIKLGV